MSSLDNRSSMKERLLNRLSIQMDFYRRALSEFKEVIKDRNVKKERSFEFSQIYHFVEDIYRILIRLEKLGVDVSKKKAMYLQMNRRFLSIYNIDKAFYSQLVTYEFMMTWTRYNSDVDTGAWLASLDSGGWGDQPEGDVLDMALESRDYMEEIMLGIKRLDHDSDYPWLVFFLKELDNTDGNFELMIKDATAHFASVNVIHRSSDYREYYPDSYWWRELEYQVYNEVKNRKDQ